MSSMSKDSMSALDFVISVLREHEKELTALSDRLEEMITSVSGEGVSRNLNEIQTILTSLKKDVQGLDRRITTSGTLDESMESILSRIEGQASLQTQSFKLLMDAIKDLPTKNDINDLRMNLSSLTSLLQNLFPKEVRGGLFPVSIKIADWSDLKRHASNPDLVVFQLSESNFSVSVHKDGKIFAYTESVPPEIDLMGKDLGEFLYGKLRCGLELVKNVAKKESGRTRIKFSMPTDFDVRTWLAWELNVSPENVVEGKIG